MKAREVLYTPAVHLASLRGYPTSVVAFTTDIPAFNGAWGQPFLIGPGSIHVAHTAEERIPKKELTEAVEIYARMVRQLLTNGAAANGYSTGNRWLRQDGPAGGPACAGIWI